MDWTPRRANKSMTLFNWMYCFLACVLDLALGGRELDFEVGQVESFVKKKGATFHETLLTIFAMQEGG